MFCVCDALQCLTSARLLPRPRLVDGLGSKWNTKETKRQAAGRTHRPGRTNSSRSKQKETIPYTTKPRCLTRALLSYAATNPVFSKSSYDALSRRGTNRRAPAGRTTSSPSDNFRTQWPNLAADFAFALLSCPNLRGSRSFWIPSPYPVPVCICRVPPLG